ncbi:MAG: zinc ribbon domain-containing protein [Lysinibacillus sp.]
MSINVKEQRQLLVQKKEARVLKMLQLGEKVHKKLMFNNFKEVDLKSDSAEILNLDKEIYALSKSLIEQTQNQGKCTKCQSPTLPDVKFCGQCGQLNSLYVDVTVPKKQCLICEEQIDEQVKFCPCCGTEQGGI